MSKRPQTRQEEKLNAISHGFALAASLTALILLSIDSSEKDFLDHVGVYTFMGALILLYGSSTMYHILKPGRWKNVFRKLDHLAIFILIAGTYTPVALGVLRGKWGWTLFILVWSIAILGIVLELSGKLKRKRHSNMLYLVMGWTAIIVIKPIIEVVPTWGLIWLALGGLFYTLGVYFYAKDNRNYYHFVWHLFVIGGSMSHFIAILYIT